MVNFNGEILADTTPLLSAKQLFSTFTDGLTERVRYHGGTILFWEDHYFRLMASMRILRMPIPLSFTMEFFEGEIEKLVKAQNTAQPLEIVITVYRNRTMAMVHGNDSVSFMLSVQSSVKEKTEGDKERFEVALFKDYYISAGLLATLHGTNNWLETVASIFARENDYDDCLLLNHEKNVVGSQLGNLFLITGNSMKTPLLEDGCKNGILRKKLIALLQQAPNAEWEIEEVSISPFELQKAEELFILDDIYGVQPITKYRKKTYATTKAMQITGMVDELLKSQLIN